MDERELVLRSWGFILLRDGYAPKRVTNTRDDKAHTKFWKDSFEKRRCLVPASAFCEPDEGKPARWHWFALKDGGDPRPPFAFAGIYRTWKGPIKKDGAQSRAGSVLLHDHADEDQYSTWLTGSPEDAFGLVKTSDPAMMEIVQSGFEKKELPAAAVASLPVQSVVIDGQLTASDDRGVPDFRALDFHNVRNHDTVQIPDCECVQKVSTPARAGATAR
jgi:SOS response associated peptidase (SRAP)